MRELPRGWTPGMHCVSPPHGIGRLVRLSSMEVIVSIETPGCVIERSGLDSFSISEVARGTEIKIPIEAVTKTLRPITPPSEAENLSRALQSRTPVAEPPPEAFLERMAALREAFLGPLEVSVRWLRRFRASEEPLSFGERRTLRILERLVAAEIELARAAAWGR
jgi:RNA polymerase-interacting CarD/CdnL/TRCF family regulator